MRDLSLHVLDIVQNSVKAQAKLVEVGFVIDDRDWLVFSVRDDGCGMTPEFLARVQDPFTTTRTTRKVGLGIPLLKENAEATGGRIDIRSQVGVGTLLTATFNLTHIDCPPMGAMCDTLLTLVLCNPEQPEFVFTASKGSLEASLDTRAVRQAVGGAPLNQPEIAAWMQESINEEFKPILEVLP